jgi:hypothetical protein
MVIKIIGFIMTLILITSAISCYPRPEVTPSYDQSINNFDLDWEDLNQTVTYIGPRKLEVITTPLSSPIKDLEPNIEAINAIDFSNYFVVAILLGLTNADNIFSIEKVRAYQGTVYIQLHWINLLSPQPSGQVPYSGLMEVPMGTLIKINKNRPLLYGQYNFVLVNNNGVINVSNGPPAITGAAIIPPINKTK